MNEREKIFILLAVAAASENLNMLQEKVAVAKKFGISSIDIKETISIANPLVNVAPATQGFVSCCK